MRRGIRSCRHHGLLLKLLPHVLTQLGHDLLLGAVDAFLHLEQVRSGLAVLEQVALGLESKSTGFTGKRALIRVDADVLFQDTRLGALYAAVRTGIPIAAAASPSLVLLVLR